MIKRDILRSLCGIFIFLLTLFFLAGCKYKIEDPVIYDKDKKLYVTLDNTFEEQTDATGAYIYLTSGDLSFSSQRQSFAWLKEEGIEVSDAYDYAGQMLALNELHTDIKKLDGKDKVTFSYTSSVEEVAYHYAVYIVTGSEEYWLCYFVCPAEEYESIYAERIDAYAETLVAY